MALDILSLTAIIPLCTIV